MLQLGLRARQRKAQRSFAICSDGFRVRTGREQRLDAFQRQRDRQTRRGKQWRAAVAVARVRVLPRTADAAAQAARVAVCNGLGEWGMSLGIRREMAPPPRSSIAKG